jgi:hypothetical protein
MLAPPSLNEEGSRESTKKWYRCLHRVRSVVLSLDRKEEAKKINKIEKEHQE